MEADNEYIGMALLSGHTFQLQNRKKNVCCSIDMHVMLGCY